MHNIVQDTILKHLPVQRTNTNNWISFNCPCCIYNGETRPDTKKRAGVQIIGSGVRFSCFNCSFKTGWQPGNLLSKKFRNLLKWLGASEEEIIEANFQAMKIKESGNFEEIENSKYNYFSYEEVELPKNSKSINEWLTQDNPPESCIKAIEYLNERNQNYFGWFEDFYWSPEIPNRIIIPFMFNEKIYGWSARIIREPKIKAELKYLNNKGQSKFLFGADRLFDDFRDYVIVTEGIFDAISVSGVATLGNNLTDTQIKWINSTNKKVIVLPDRDTAGQQLIDIAIENGWYVSFPAIFDRGIKDADDAVRKFGRLITVKTIIDSKVSNPLQLNILRGNWKQ